MSCKIKLTEMFQFQYGAIGSLLGFAGKLRVKRFNSSMVRLGDRMDSEIYRQLRCFNSSMVRLGDTNNSLKNILQMFQFQYGAIGSRQPNTLMNSFTFVSIPVWCDWESLPFSMLQHRHRFQFQYGAIGRSMLTDATDGVVSFNSSMVRLGVIACLTITFIWLFQFQYGAIGSPKCQAIPARDFRFNSSMVRLGDGKPVVQRLNEKRFNSSMVRLGGNMNQTFSLTTKFQFQYGAIGSTSSRCLNPVVIPFQFQYGAIGSVDCGKPEF